MEEIKRQKETPESIFDLADHITEIHKELPEIIQAIQKGILDHARLLQERYEPKSIVESRFTPAEEAFKKGILSCGAMANMATAILRYLGYEVKLVHGESEESVDHAWISVHDQITDSWDQYDLTREVLDVPPTHVVKKEVDSWDDIKDEIVNDHETLRERRKVRGL